MAVGPASIYDISATRKRFDVNKQIAQLGTGCFSVCRVYDEGAEEGRRLGEVLLV